MASEHANTLPIFWGHGENDDLVKIKRATDSRDFLKAELSIQDSSGVGSAGLAFNIYKGMGHTVDNQEQEDLSEWLRKVVPK